MSGDISSFALLWANTLQKIQDYPLRPEHCAQLVEAIRLADIPAELEKQIKTLQQAADEHSLRQDDQLQNIISIRAELEQMTSEMKDVLDVLKTHVRSSRNDRQHLIGLNNAHIGRLTKVLEKIETSELEKAIKDQQKTIDALRSFLEDKVSASQKESIEDKSDASKWPSATITAAYVAATLFSSVASMCATRTIMVRTFPDVTQTRIQDLIESRKKYRISSEGRVNVDTPQASSALSEESVSARKAATTSDGNSQHGSWPVLYENWLYEYRTMGSPPAPPRRVTSSLAKFFRNPGADSRLSKLSEPCPVYDPVFSDSDGS
ncbi:uncharacterized protein CDV56_106509 [Aspergillus thermomutatus]|uniref:Uncharacterized protein n=1 Tax=Aspergillus thermomutatus TaxID=41047 RepID=A0A397H341_ASPTH|nr:uncharacterized protein CDV56_106509 [Aspergillus thermomutatus]RHZ56278.1 hypothetical protein CDV56_106509 [Aspergillus thermomutatus]